MRTPGRKMVIYGLLAFSAVLLGIILAIVSKG